MQLIQLVLQLQLMGICMARAAVEEAGGPVPGLLPTPRGVQPAGLQHTSHFMKKPLLQALHALLHLHNTIQVSWHDASHSPWFISLQCVKLGCRREKPLKRHINDRHINCCDTQTSTSEQVNASVQSHGSICIAQQQPISCSQPCLLSIFCRGLHRPEERVKHT